MAKLRRCQKLKWIGLSIVLLLIGVECLSIFWYVNCRFYHANYFFRIGEGYVRMATVCVFRPSDVPGSQQIVTLCVGNVVKEPRRPIISGAPISYQSRPIPKLDPRYPAPFLYSFTSTITRYLDIELWFLILVAAISTAFLWWYDKRYRLPVHLCRKCEYDLTLNISGTCPECGTLIPSDQRLLLSSDTQSEKAV